MALNRRTLSSGALTPRRPTSYPLESPHRRPDAPQWQVKMKVMLRLATNISTCNFETDPPTLSSIFYPLDESGDPIPPTHLADYLTHRDLPFPHCMCGDKCRMVVCRAKANRGKHAFACAHGYRCLWWQFVEDVLQHHGGLLFTASHREVSLNSLSVPTTPQSSPVSSQGGQVSHTRAMSPGPVASGQWMDELESFFNNNAPRLNEGPPKLNLSPWTHLTMPSSPAKSTSTASSGGIGPIFDYSESGYVLPFPDSPLSHSRAFDHWMPPPTTSAPSSWPSYPTASTMSDIISKHGLTKKVFWNSFSVCEVCQRIVHRDWLVERVNEDVEIGGGHVCLIDLTDEDGDVKALNV
ncbi:hypothetical protein NEOLEDRAFT_1182616 [Neolentinus lepideus HHB14362 ss-1]|uniref:Uncharacterized protein n=1 Tax=Neolentinus lepideus HHB14362 ss-1 TaxID=1314782 RepID=A0A165NYR7_9AGAM|nr:hypothetical protein NEOLEDRAFT_1182616 [Neolentinus lepideus HHB14362 ss-1]